MKTASGGDYELLPIKIPHTTDKLQQQKAWNEYMTDSPVVSFY